MQPRDRLTSKEVQVATLAWQGLTYNDIAGVIGTSEQVVKNHLRTTFNKLGVWTLLELALNGRLPWRRQLACIARQRQRFAFRLEGTSALEAGVLATGEAKAATAAISLVPTIISVKAYWLLTPTRRAPSEIAHHCPRNGK